MSINLKIDFYGFKISVVKDQGYYWVPVKQICDDIGINSQKQTTKIKANEMMSWVYHMVYAGLQKRETFCLRKDFLGGWLFSIQIKSIRDNKTKTRLSLYQKEACKVLDDYFTQGIAVNLNPTIEQGEELKKELEQNPQLAEYFEEQASYIQQLKKEITEMKTDVQYGTVSPNTGMPCIHLHRASYYPSPRSKEQIEKDRLKKLNENQPLLPGIITTNQF